MLVPDPLSPSRKVREGLHIPDVISMHEMLTNEIYCSILSNDLASVGKANTGAVLGLQIKQVVN